MVADSAFEGWCGLTADSAEGNMQWQGFQPKAWEETDVDIEVSSESRQDSIQSTF